MASTVSQIIEDIRSFRPMDIKFIQRCINDFLDEKYHNGIPNHMNYGAHIERYPKCGSVHFVKNGFDYNHKQKYRFKDCNAVFSATTGTMFSNRSVSSIRRILLRYLCLINQCLEKSVEFLLIY